MNIFRNERRFVIPDFRHRPFGIGSYARTLRIWQGRTGGFLVQKKRRCSPSLRNVDEKPWRSVTADVCLRRQYRLLFKRQQRFSHPDNKFILLPDDLIQPGFILNIFNCIDCLHFQHAPFNQRRTQRMQNLVIQNRL